MANVLLAASAEPRAIFERILEGHNLSCPQTLEAAAELLRTCNFDLIACTVFFDESRMFDLLRLAKSKPEWRDIPFVCARLRTYVLDSPIAREGVKFTCMALGASAYLDVADYPTDFERELRHQIDGLIGAGSLPKVETVPLPN